MKPFVQKVIKLSFYIFLSLITGRSVGNPETWMSDSLASQLGHLFYGPGEIGADNFYDLYTYVFIITVFSITTMIYCLTMKLIKKIRSK